MGPERPSWYIVKQVDEGRLCAEEWVDGDLARSRRPLVPLFYMILATAFDAIRLTRDDS